MSIVLQFCCDIVEGEVQTYADLPPAADHLGEIWAVLTSTGIWPFNKVAGFYISNGVTWNVFSAFNFPSISATSPITFDTSTGEISTSIATNKLVGRSTSGAGVMEEITIGSGLNLSAGTLISTGSGGTVTNVSVATANGVFGSVANPTTTPEITLTLGAITPSSVAASGTLSGSNFSGSSSGTNTGDQDLSTYVQGAASVTDNTLVVYNGTTGKVIKGSNISHDPSTENTTFPNNVSASASKSGSAVQINVTNTSATANSDARLDATTAVGGGSPKHTLSQGSVVWSQGVDASDSIFKRQWSTTSFSTPFETVTQGGVFTTPLQPDFLAYKSAFSNNVTGDGSTYTLVCDTEVYDQNNNYDATTGIFTAPVAGIYSFYSCIHVGGLLSTHTNSEVRLVTSTTSIILYKTNVAAIRAPSGFMTINVNSCETYMNAGDTALLEMNIFNGTKVVDVYGQASSPLYTWFSGRKNN